MSVLASLKPASLTDRFVAYMADLARSARRLVFKRVRRTSTVVEGEYNAGHWDRILKAQAWVQTKDPATFLVGEDRRPRLAKVEGRIVRIATDEYYRYRLGALQRLLARHAGETDALVELGVGFGYNLLSVGLDRRWQRLRGLDIAPNGIEAGRRIAAHFGLSDRLNFGSIDLTSADDPGFAEVKKATVFTYFCIEQIPYAVENVVENILRAGPRRVINIEPNAEMLDFTRARDIVSYAYIRSVDYQTRLFTVLDALERSGRIRIIARERMEFAPTIHNDGLLYCWEPVGTAGLT